jgi:hypothetical protein
LKPAKKQEIDVNKIMEAAYDYKFLLSRGYSHSLALNTVSQRYMLNKYEKLLLFRCVHSTVYVHETLKKIKCNYSDTAKHGLLVMDFYNILLTIIALIEHDIVFLCDDCLVRDLRGSKLRSSERAFLTESYSILADILQQHQFFEELIIVSDKNISHSLEDTQTFVSILHDKLRGVKVTYTLTTTPDTAIISFAQKENTVITSTDSLIIEKSRRILPLTTIALSYMKARPLINFPQFFGLSCPTCSQNS